MSLGFITLIFVFAMIYLFNAYKLRYGIRYYVYKREKIYYIKIFGFWGRNITPSKLRSGFKDLTLLYEELDKYVLGKRMSWTGYKDFQRKYDDYYYKNLEKRILR